MILSIIFQTEKEHSQVDGLISHHVEGGVSLLQYAMNDIIIFVDHNIEKALDMKLILVYSSSCWG
jgi:hypothetical protein